MKRPMVRILEGKPLLRSLPGGLKLHIGVNTPATALLGTDKTGGDYCPRPSEIREQKQLYETIIQHNEPVEIPLQLPSDKEQ